jgi:hypothetical protein
MPDLTYLRAEIEHMRRQMVRQRREIRDLERAGIPTKSAEELLERMLTRPVRGAGPPRQEAARHLSRHGQGHQRGDRAPLPLSVYRGILSLPVMKTRLRSRCSRKEQHHGATHQE